MGEKRQLGGENVTNVYQHFCLVGAGDQADSLSEPVQEFLELRQDQLIICLSYFCRSILNLLSNQKELLNVGYFTYLD